MLQQPLAGSSLAARDPPRTASPLPDLGRDSHRARPGPAMANWSSWVTIRIGRTVAALQSHLVRAVPVKLEEKVFAYAQPAARPGVQPRHPATHSIRIELLIPRIVERVGEIDAPAVAA